MSIVVNTPNGNIGRGVAERLLAAGQPVTVISREASKVADLVARGARLVTGSFEDPAVLDAALAGATALFWVTPPTYRPDRDAWLAATTGAAADAVRRNGVRRVVVVSSTGAQHGRGTGPVNALGAIERAFQAVAPDVAVLRCAFFMENLLQDAPTLAAQGAIYGPVPADKAFAIVATRDIAGVAAARLLDRSWGGHATIGVHGPEDVTYSRVAAILTEALGKPVTYVPVPLAAARQGMLDGGMPPFLAGLFTELLEAMSSGRLDPAEPRTAESTTPTSLRAFAREVIRPAVAAAG